MKTIRIRKSTLQSGIVTRLIVIYLLIMSGSALQHHDMNFLQKINIFVAAFLFVKQWLKNGATFIIRKNCLDIFMVLSAVGLVLVAVIWWDFTDIGGYIGSYCLLLTSYYISQRDDIEQIKTDFVNTILFLAVISLILFWGQAITSKLPYIDLSNGNYKYYILYAQYSQSHVAVLNRNIGIFWEPGMYQGIVIFAMLLIALDKTNVKNEFLKQTILFVTVLSTQSTTGLLLLPLVVFVYVMKRLEAISVKLQYVAIIVVLCAFFLLFFSPDPMNAILGLFPGEVVDKLIDEDNISRNTRLYNFIVDGTIILRNPFGVPGPQIGPMRDSIRDTFFADTDSSTTLSSLAMAITYGIVPAILYLYLIIKGCINFACNKFIAILVLVIFLVIINTEAHYLCLLLNVFIFHYASRTGDERKKNESIVAH